MKRVGARRRLFNALGALPGGHSLLRLARRVRAGGLRLGAESVPAGHFYSVIPSAEDLRRAEVAAAVNEAPRGVDLNTVEQVRMLRAWLSLREDVPFYSRQRRIRFDIENNSFSYDDAPVLAYMLRTIRPRRVIEIGSGNSSACMLDVCDLYPDSDPVGFTFIDVDCAPLRAMLLPRDLERVQILEQPVQHVELSLFDSLQENDLLFVDSSHVLKAGSDLSTILFEVLPRLREGVVVHFHDIRYPFRYSRGITQTPLFWNEAYALRAFLQYNRRFSVLFWTNFLITTEHRGALTGLLPLDQWQRRFGADQCDYADAGGSLYLRTAAPLAGSGSV